MMTAQRTTHDSRTERDVASKHSSEEIISVLPYSPYENVTRDAICIHSLRLPGLLYRRILTVHYYKPSAIKILPKQ